MRVKPKAIVLGGTSAHIPLIRNLQERGYHAVLVDYYENPPAKYAADTHIVQSTLDFEKVLETTRRLRAQLVISACVDQANLIACSVAENLGLPVPYGRETALSMTDKLLMKRKMGECGIPTSKYICLKDAGEIEGSGLKFPVVVKPSDSNGSKEVRKAGCEGELKKYFELAFRVSRNKKVIVEEFKDGPEIQADFFVRERVPHLIMMRRKYRLSENNESELQPFVSLIPAEVSRATQERLEAIASTVVRVFDLHTTSLLIQAIVDEEELNVIEFAPRVGGGVSCSLIKMVTGFDMLDATVDSYLGINADVVSHRPLCCYSVNNIFALPCVYNRIDGFEDLKKQNVIEKFFKYKMKGSKIDSGMASRNRVGAFIVKAGCRAELLEKIRFAVDELEIYDIHNRPVMRKDLYTGPGGFLEQIMSGDLPSALSIGRHIQHVSSTRG